MPSEPEGRRAHECSSLGAAVCVEHGPSAIPYSPCSHCDNMCLPGELEHCPGLGSDCYLCAYCHEQEQEAQFDRLNQDYYGG